MKDFKGKNVLITGGAAGIGKIMGEMVLRRGANLIIWDKDKIKLEETVSQFSKIGKVSGYQLDISDTSEIIEMAKKVKEIHGVIDLLINNAGIVVGKYFHDHSSQDIEQTMSINANAPMIVALQFLPDMIKQNSGHICNIASSAGLISNPRMSVYCASKWSVIGWSDSVRLEMKLLNKNIGITTVTPYYINTGMFNGVRSIIPIIKPETAAKKIIKGIELNKIFVSMPWSVGFVRFSQGLLPIWMFDWFVGKVLGVYRSMDHFTGHKK